EPPPVPYSTLVRARGGPTNLNSDSGRSGLIPACAGSTARRSPTATARWAHPRMRGEHSSPPFSGGRVGGSSPHARGAQDLGWHLVGAQGLIPACAGST